MNYSTLSPESETCSRSPAISSTAFDTRPPDLPPASLMDTDFAISCPLDLGVFLNFGKERVKAGIAVQGFQIGVVFHTLCCSAG